MKREHLLWIMGTMAGAAPILEPGQGAEFEGLRFGLDGTFKISVFEDLHFGEAENTLWGPEQDRKTVKVLNTLLDNDRPNLAVLNGDLITGEDTYSHNNTAYLDQLLGPLIQRNVPWASTYGNHDHQRTLSGSSLLAREKERGPKLSYTESMLPGNESKIGTTNYYVPIYSSTGGGNPTLVLLLWFFDSRGGRAYNQTKPDGTDVPTGGWVDQDVINWFNAEKMGMQQAFKRTIPSLVFVHIPTHASWSFQQKVGIDPNTEPGINDEGVAPQGDACDEQGKCSYAGLDSPFMKSLVETDGLIAVFSGHDHGLDWCMKWSATEPLPENDPGTGNDVFMCFGRHTGYGGYGTWTRGARQIVLYEEDLGKKEVETWIGLEDGRVSGHVVLNGTYGVDRYPTVSGIAGEGDGRREDSERD
ncbi:Metallo-dependent phosphatase [Lojkania enalia]|uniref:Metallo-dependent phosphatase n=1 Tax=Lojkania enalia TaxID=147567 RepID=A0A9P4KJI9_9PLEO|nr:Metallo-dependent phosphatase [Didymosphaeria enalia]